MPDQTATHPGKIFALASAYWQPCALHAAVKLAVFTNLAIGPATAPELAARLGADPRSLAALLNGLTAMGLLEKEQKLFRNTPLTARYLDRNSPDYAGHIVMHHHHLVEAWSRLDEAVLSGEPVERRGHGEEAERESFQMGMFNLASAIAPELAGTVTLTGVKHLLDLGGGPGTHAVYFCLANPHLRATVFDRPTSHPFATEVINRFGVSGRVDFVAGDFLADPLPVGYDAVWLSQILHGLAPQDCRRLIARSVATLPPGGRILIHEFLLNDDLAGPLFPALFSLNMLVNNQGRSYSEKELREMLGEAGVEEIVRLPFRSGNDSAVLQGIKG
jgi:predicted O-methyltransferase YrrM